MGDGDEFEIDDDIGGDEIDDYEWDNNEFVPEAPDPDEEYERARDAAGDALSGSIDELIEQFVAGRGGFYYAGETNREKLITHMIATLQSKVKKE